MPKYAICAEFFLLKFTRILFVHWKKTAYQFDELCCLVARGFCWYNASYGERIIRRILKPPAPLATSSM